MHVGAELMSGEVNQASPIEQSVTSWLGSPECKRHYLLPSPTSPNSAGPSVHSVLGSLTMESPKWRIKQHNMTTEERLAFARTPPSGAHMLCMGFYPTQSMWVGRAVTPFPGDLVSSPELEVAMHQAIRTYHSQEDFSLFIARDGLVVVALKRSIIDREEKNADAAVDGIAVDMYAGSSGTEYGRKWALYLDYLNATHLLLAAARQSFLQSSGAQFISEVTVTNAIVFRHFFDDPLHRFAAPSVASPGRPRTAR